MTVSTTNSRISQNGNGSSTAFSGPYILSASDLSVYVNGALKTLTTDYSVSSVGVSAGCLVTFVTAPPAGTGNVVFVRDPDQKQETDLPSNDPFPSNAVERALDKLTMLVQRCRDLLARALVLDDSDTSTPGKIPSLADRRNNLLGFDANGNPIAVAPNSQDATSVATKLATLVPSMLGSALRFARVNAAETALEYRTPSQVKSDLGIAMSDVSGVAAITQGGTGASTAAAARTALGLAIGTDVQPFDANLHPTVGSAVQATTSGAFVDFPGIPSWVTKITIMPNGVSTNGTSEFQIQLGTSAGIQTTGYNGTGATLTSAGTVANNLSSGFVLPTNGGGASYIRNGAITLTLMDAANGVWACNGMVGLSDSARISIVVGTKQLSGTLDRLRLGTVGGTDAFDLGASSIRYE